MSGEIYFISSNDFNFLNYLNFFIELNYGNLTNKYLILLKFILQYSKMVFCSDSQTLHQYF